MSLIKCLTNIIDDIRLLVLSLPQNRPNRMGTSIIHNLERKAPIGQFDDGGSNEGLFYPVKCFKTLISKTNGVSLAKSKVRGLVIL